MTREVCTHGVRDGAGCAQCVLAATRKVVADDAVAPARAQLWARVYAAQFEVCMHRPSYHETGARWDAVQTADAAVRDFDEHYLGGKR